MNKIIIVSLFTAALLSGCKSTADVKSNDASLATNSSTTKVLDQDLETIAKNTNFSSSELSAAAKELGYKCVMVRTTGSRITKKVCGTAQQRKIREQAASNYMESATHAAGNNIVNGG